MREIVFAPCPDPRTFAFLEHMRDARKAIKCATVALTFARANYPQDRDHEWPQPSLMREDLAATRRFDKPAPTTGTGCVVWGADKGEIGTLDEHALLGEVVG